jgi:hypothetical protein
MGRSRTLNTPFGLLVTGIRLTAIVAHSREFSDMGYDLFLFEKWMGEIYRYHKWRETWDTTEEEDWIRGYATLHARFATQRCRS